MFSQARPNKGTWGERREGQIKKKRSHEDAAEAKKSIFKIGEGQVPPNHHFLLFVAIALDGKNPSGKHFLTIILKVIPAWVLGIMVFDAFRDKPRKKRVHEALIRRGWVKDPSARTQPNPKTQF